MSAATMNYGGSVRPAAPESMSLWAYFIRSITSKYAAFSGRARRKEFWAFQLFVTLTLVGLCIAAALLIPGAEGAEVAGDSEVSVLAAVIVCLVGIAVLGVIVPSIALTVRRLHDIGMSGWWFLLTLIPTVGFVAFLIFGLIPSQPANKYGPSPL